MPEAPIDLRAVSEALRFTLDEGNTEAPFNVVRDARRYAETLYRGIRDAEALLYATLAGAGFTPGDNMPAPEVSVDPDGSLTIRVQSRAPESN